MKAKETITVSLIIPVYNVSPYIDRCLKSVINQTYNRFECILVDDASPDDSVAICERIISEYEGPIQFRVLHHPLNRGLSAARNTGIEAATGDYILFIDSDDVISNDCVERLMVPVLRDPSIEMVIGEQIRFSEKGFINRGEIAWRQEEDLVTNESIRNLYYDRFFYLPPAAWNRLTSRSFINRYHLRFKEGQLWEDTLWTFFELKHLSHVYLIPDVTYYYYYRPDSMSSGTNNEERNIQWCNLCESITENFTPGDESREAVRYVGSFCSKYVKRPKNKACHATARRFAKALPFRKYPHERILLWAVMWLPHNETGKNIFKWLQKKNKRPRA